VVNVHALIAVGVNAEGYREILASTSAPPRRAGWLTFWRSLTPRLSGVKLVTSDAHAGLVAAIAPPCPGRPGSGAAPTTRPT